MLKTLNLTAAILLTAALAPTSALASSYATLGGVTEHLGSIGYINDTGYHAYNELNKNMLGLELVNETSNVGLGFMSFSNSYSNPSALMFASKYWPVTNQVKVGLLAGVVYGYTGRQMDTRLKIADKLHAMVAPTVKFDTDDLFSQVSLYGKAIVLSGGFKF